MPEPLVPVVQTMDALPPGAAGLVVPHEETFSAIYNLTTKAYSWQFDEALFDNIDNAVAMRFDPVIMEPLETRMRTTAQLTWHLEPEDAEDASLVKAAADLEKRVRRMPRFQDFLMAQLEALWPGRAGAQVVYRWWRNKDSRLGLVPVDHYPIDGDKLVFRYDRTVGIRVNGLYHSENTQIGEYGRVHYFSPDERQALVVHRHRPEDAPYFRPRKAGMIHGVGLRERLYWFWAMKNQVLGLLSDYIRWFAQGLTIYYYEMGNPAALAEVRRRAEENVGKPFLLFPRERNGNPAWKPVERFEPGSASTNLMQALVTSYFDMVIRRMILGQTLTTSAAPTGLGSNLATVQENTFAGVIKYDATALADTLSLDFVSVINAWTYPGYPSPRWVFEIDSPNVEQLISAASFFIQNGGEVGAESMRKMLGLPAPKPNEAVLGKLQPQQPTAVGGLPQGVPVYEASQKGQGGGVGEDAPEAGAAVG